MTLGLNDLHPAMRDILQARVDSLFGHHGRPEDASARSVMGRRWKGIGWRILAALPLGALFGATTASAFGAPRAQ
jgi:hypothetical protein